MRFEQWTVDDSIYEGYRVSHVELRLFVMDLEGHTQISAMVE